MATARDIADRMDRDQKGLERLGVARAGEFGRRARVAVLRAFRAGEEPTGPMTQALRPLETLLVEGMVAGHLTGRLRAVRLIEQRAESGGVELAESPYAAAIEAVRAQINVTDEDLSRLRASYGAESARTVQTLNTMLGGRVARTMEQITSDNLHVRDGVKRLRQTFSAAGVLPDRSHTLETIFRTQTQLSYAAGRDQVFEDPDVADIVWGYEYVTVGDDRVRPNHAAMDGVRLPKADAWWQRNTPPNGWNCRCARVPVFEGDAAARASRVRAPQPRNIDGAQVAPEADPDFRFNPSAVVPAPLGG